MVQMVPVDREGLAGKGWRRPKGYPFAAGDAPYPDWSLGVPACCIGDADCLYGTVRPLHAGRRNVDERWTQSFCWSSKRMAWLLYSGNLPGLPLWPRAARAGRSHDVVH